MSNICVLGSINMDTVYEVDSIPKEGETISAKSLNFYPGGKGLNQAISASRLGGNVAFIGRVGNDSFGDKLLDVLFSENVNIECVKHDEYSSSGQAVIMIDNQGKNCITVLGGANMELSNEDIVTSKNIILKSNVIVSQLEVPINVILEAFKFAKQNKVLTILNPAPAKDIPEELYEFTDIIVPNESELERISGRKILTINDAIEASMTIIDKGIEIVIATLGDQGALIVLKNSNIHVKGEKVKAVDTTAAGDSFIGALSYRLSKNANLTNENLIDIVKFANKVASLTVQRKGAQPSLPYSHEIEV